MGIRLKDFTRNENDIEALARCDEIALGQAILYAIRKKIAIDVEKREKRILINTENIRDDFRYKTGALGPDGLGFVDELVAEAQRVMAKAKDKQQEADGS